MKRRCVVLIVAVMFLTPCGCTAPSDRTLSYTLVNKTPSATISENVSSGGGETVTEIRVWGAKEDFDPVSACYSPEADTFVIDAGNGVFSVENGMLLSADGTEFLRCPVAKAGEIVVPDGVRVIGNLAFFRCRNVTAIRLPQSVEQIGNEAFRGCGALRRVNIPSAAKVVGISAIAECDALESVLMEGRSQTPDGWANDWFCGPANVLVWNADR